MPGNITADEPPTPAVAPNAAPISDNSAPSDNPASSDNPQIPANPPPPANPPGTNTPLLPPQPGNPYLSLPSSSSSNTQSTQLTAPALYTTGANDLSQVAVNSALAEAFGQQGASGYSTGEGSDSTYNPLQRIRLGPIDLRATLLMDVVSDDNLTAGEGSEQKISDTDFGVTPAILLEYGTHEGQKGYASLVYAPTFTEFLNHSDQNSDNQNVTLSVQYPFQRLTLNFSQTYAEVTGINQDLNRRTTQTSFVSTLGANYDIDDKLSFSSQLQELITSFSNGEGQGDKISSINSSLSYHLSEKMTLGPSLNVGYEEPEDAQSQTFQQALLELNYQPTEKISLFAQGGVEFRQYDQGGDVTNPIFSAGIGYAPFDSTRLSLNAYQNVHASSADSEQTVLNTGVGFSATQRLMQRIFFTFSMTYSHNENQTGTSGTDQSAAIPTTAGTRQNNLVYRPSVSYAPSEWTSVALYYQYLDNDSNTPGGTYHDNQMGISVSAQF